MKRMELVPKFRAMSHEQLADTAARLAVAVYRLRRAPAMNMDDIEDADDAAMDFSRDQMLFAGFADGEL